VAVIPALRRSVGWLRPGRQSLFLWLFTLAVAVLFVVGFWLTIRLAFIGRWVETTVSATGRWLASVGQRPVCRKLGLWVT